MDECGHHGVIGMLSPGGFQLQGFKFLQGIWLIIGVYGANGIGDGLKNLADLAVGDLRADVNIPAGDILRLDGTAADMDTSALVSGGFIFTHVFLQK
jgi:hypothetical protein